MSKDVRKAERLAEMQKREAEKVKARSNDSSSSSCQCSTLGKRGTLDGALKQLSIRSTEKKQDVSVSSSSDLVKNITTKNSEQVMEKKKSTTTTTTDNDGDEEEEDVVKSSRTSAKIENLLDSLPFCVNADLVLNFAVDFCYLNSKTARAQLVEKLFRAPRMALELLPYYSLLVAILSKVFDDIAEPLETLLCGEFRGLQNKKDVAFNRRESKIRNARFIGELIKFRVFAPKIAFYVRHVFDTHTHEYPNVLKFTHSPNTGSSILFSGFLSREYSDCMYPTRELRTISVSKQTDTHKVCSTTRNLDATERKQSSRSEFRIPHRQCVLPMCSSNHTRYQEKGTNADVFVHSTFDIKSIGTRSRSIEQKG